MARVVDTNSYHVDLAELMRIYETNYAKLNRLIPTLQKSGMCAVIKLDRSPIS